MSFEREKLNVNKLSDNTMTIETKEKHNYIIEKLRLIRLPLLKSYESNAKIYFYLNLFYGLNRQL